MIRTAKEKPNEFKHERVVHDIPILLPKCPNQKLIANYDLPINKQKWILTPIPDNFKKLPIEEQISFLNQELERRKNGYWFYNHGNIEYITGIHYFYLCYWRIDGLVPYWKDSDRDFFYAWDTCVTDEDCYGLLFITNRRDGKTGKSTAILYEYVSKTENAHAGIQSKTTKDAKQIFGKIISSWKKLHPIWKPTDSGDSNPKGSLNFEEPGMRSSKGLEKEYHKVLNSVLDFMPSTDEAYDGTKLMRLYHDEIGKKTKEADVENRWYICKPCLEDGSEIIGKAILTTTVEEIDKEGGSKCKNLWDMSDFLDKAKREDNRTISGLYRFFKPAYYGLAGYIDEYGYSVIEDPEKPVLGLNGKLISQGSKEYLRKRRSGLTGSLLSNEKKKYPFTIEEAFRIDNRDSQFDLNKIYSQVDFNQSLDQSVIQKGNFLWIQEYSSVYWQPDKNGKWEITWMPKEEHRNLKISTNNRIGPANIHTIVSGADPFDHYSTTDGRKSDGASHVFRMFDPMQPETSAMFVSQYCNRPPKPEIFYDDMIKQSIFYGCQLLSENNKIGLINWFKQKGMERYLMSRPEPTHTAFSAKHQKEFGIPMTSEEARGALVGAIQTYVYDKVGYNEDTNEYGNLFFQDLLDEWAKFDVNNWTPFDKTVSSGLALLGSRKYVPKPKSTNVPDNWSLAKTYSQRGFVSKRNG